ncbi:OVEREXPRESSOR OF CATIONIC PEROXIDASE 3-like protein [Drosera capensis]
MAALAPPQHTNTILPRRLTAAVPSSSPTTSRHHFFSGHRVSVPSLLLSASFLCSARRRPIPSLSNLNKKKNKKRSITKDDMEEDPLEALFKQLEYDLANDNQMQDGEDDISELDLAQLDDELKGILGEDEEELMGEYTEEEEEEEEDDEPDKPVKLKRWQLRRLAYALKKGRRKISILDLCGELNLARPLVLELLREPPPELLMMSASLPDTPEPAISMPETVEAESVSGETQIDPSEPAEPYMADPEVKLPIHVLQSTWSARKRIKKAHVATLEKVYYRSKRPTDAMISSISHLTNLPRKRIVQWFEEKRAADDLPERHNPHRWVASKSTKGYQRERRGSSDSVGDFFLEKGIDITALRFREQAYAPERYYTNSYNWHPGAEHSSKKRAIPEIFEADRADV